MSDTLAIRSSLGAASEGVTRGQKSFLLIEQSLHQFFPIHRKVRRNVREDCRKCAHPKRLMSRNCDVMLPMLGGGQPDMATRLSSDLITKSLQRFNEFV